MLTKKTDFTRGILMVLILDPLEKALESLQRAIQQPKNEYIRDSVIQRFEYTYELSWKMLKRLLIESEGKESIEPLNRKDLFRLAGEKRIIDDVESWFEFHKARNMTSHIYKESIAEETYEIAKKFAIQAGYLFSEIKNRNHD